MLCPGRQFARCDRSHHHDPDCDDGDVTFPPTFLATADAVIE
jgi:hypothetical protein